MKRQENRLSENLKAPKRNPKNDGAVGVVVEGNPDDPSEKPSVMDLVEATLSPHLRAAATAQQKSKRVEDEAAGRQFNGKWRLARNWNSQILPLPLASSIIFFKVNIF